MTLTASGNPTMDLFLHHIAPGLGALVALAMFSSPFKTVLHIRKTQSLGDMNPIPMIAIIANTTSWLIYGCLTRDPYVIAANEPGLMLGIFMSVSCYAFASPKVRDSMMQALMFFAFLITGVSIYIAMALTEHKDKMQASGYLSVTVLLLYYAAPLSVLAKVLKTRNSVSLFWPLSVMSCLNGFLWVAYGLAVGDAFIWAPNTAGAALGVIQLLLILILPRRSESEAVDTDATTRLLKADDETPEP